MKMESMKIAVTGSLGHIGKLLVQELAQKGHTVIVELFVDNLLAINQFFKTINFMSV